LHVKNAKPVSENVVAVPLEPGIDGLSSLIKLEADEYSTGGNQVGLSSRKLITNACEVELEKSNVSFIDSSKDSKLVAIAALRASPDKASLGSSLVNMVEKWGLNNDSLKSDNPDSHFTPRSSGSLATADEMDTGVGVGGDDGTVEHTQPTCSSMADSSNVSCSIMRGSSSSSMSFEEEKRYKFKSSCVDSGSKLL
jgi:hypothetical protein